MLFFGTLQPVQRGATKNRPPTPADYPDPAPLAAMINIKALVPLQEVVMLVTVIPVIYRDTNGIRTHGELRLDGVLTAEQNQTLKSALYDGLEFVPGQLGLTHYGAAESSTFPGPNDHGWHMLLVDDAVIVDDEDVPSSVELRWRSGEHQAALT
jgi:hypothetical protein